MLAALPFREGGAALKSNIRPSTIDIDLDHAGLFCRAAPSCRRVFHPASQDSEAHMAVAVAERDLHESAAHAYTHVVVQETPFSFATYHALRRTRDRELGR